MKFASTVISAVARCVLLGALIFTGPIRAVTLTDDLSLYLPFSGDLRDHSAAKHSITNIGGVRLADGAAYFSGHSNWLEAPHLDLTGAFALSMWIKPSGTHPMYGLVEQLDTNELNRWFHVMLRGGRQPYLGFLMNDAISPRDIPVNQWTHLVFQHNGQRQEIWVNGRFLCARESAPYLGKKGITRIGYTPRWNNVPSRDFEGFMRELRLYRRNLSSQEIQTLFSPQVAAAKPVAAQLAVPEQIQPSVLNEAPGTVLGSPFLSIAGNKLTITGEARQVVEIQATTDLNQPWQHVTLLTNQSGVTEFTDRQAAGNARFYRIEVKTK